MLGGLQLLLCLCLLFGTLQAEDAASCSAAGVGRAAFRDQGAVSWLSSENAKRAPYYIAQAKRMYEKGVRQSKGIDKSNSDPFIALYDAQHQVLGALDLASGNASTWLGAGQATAMIASLSDDGDSKRDEAVRMFAKACQLDAGSMDAILSWAKSKVAGEEAALTKMKKGIGKLVLKKWKTEGIPKVTLESFVPVVAQREESEVCSQGSPMPPVDSDVALDANPQKQINAALASMNVRPLFPTLITSVNVGQYFGKDFSEKLAAVSVKKFRAFSDKQKKKGQKDANDINDAFFREQQKKWPELHKSKEYEMLNKFMKGALVEHAAKTGYALSAKDQDSAHMHMWVAVYLEDGGRHGYHVHQGSFSSCVFYAKAPPGKTPIMFMDPRGAPPTHDYEQHLGERDFEPVAPFHHNYHFFAEAGDLVCFPSWLVHRVPSHFEDQERVAFAANLQADEIWDAWYRSSTLG